MTRTLLTKSSFGEIRNASLKVLFNVLHIFANTYLYFHYKRKKQLLGKNSHILIIFL